MGHVLSFKRQKNELIVDWEKIRGVEGNKEIKFFLRKKIEKKFSEEIVMTLMYVARNVEWEKTMFFLSNYCKLGKNEIC